MITEEFRTTYRVVLPAGKKKELVNWEIITNLSLQLPFWKKNHQTTVDHTGMFVCATYFKESLG